jgi:hypothetical protein
MLGLTDPRQRPGFPGGWSRRVPCGLTALLTLSFSVEARAGHFLPGGAQVPVNWTAGPLLSAGSALEQ